MSGLYSSLKEFTAEELMNGDNQYDTDDPGQRRFGKQDAIKGFKFQKLPPILQITLKRFEFNQQEMQMVKILDKYEYSPEIDMQDFVDDSLKSKTKGSSQFKYSLYAVLIHSGQKSGSGHYYVFIRKGDGWFKFNDKVVEPVSWMQVLLGGEGGVVEYPEFDQKDNKIKYTKVTKMETAYMLVYVQKSKEKKLLSELTIDDIPKNIQEQYQENKKLTQQMERNSRYELIKLLSFEDVLASSGNALLFQKPFCNSEVNLESIQAGQIIEVSKSISVEVFLTQLADQLDVHVKDLIVFKLFFNQSLERERLVNISQLLDFSADKFNLLELLSGKGEQIKVCLLVLRLDPSAEPLKLKQIKEISDEQIQISQNHKKNSVQKQNNGKLPNNNNSQQFVVFCKRMCHREGSSSELQSDVLEQIINNELIAYVVVSRTENSLVECLVALADLKQLNYEKFLTQHRFYIESNYQLDPIIDIHSHEPIAEIFSSRFYGVLVLEPVTDEYSLLDIANRYYAYRQTHLGILFSEYLKSSDNENEAQQALLTIDKEYTLETLQRTIKDV